MIRNWAGDVLKENSRDPYGRVRAGNRNKSSSQSLHLSAVEAPLLVLRIAEIQQLNYVQIDTSLHSFQLGSINYAILHAMNYY